ncbi:hypothetical protein BpHYR1_020855 [Brachionus plicatilis]|uniref:Uncharacterized protein n=1 Tax=Brachionus plicatilis TaxID=10195 RepID=A0A3M7R1Z2_BRAPC|nr:hypothetical protein BpHYR1_020855 [Brachionus plicatilis]
MEILSLFLIDSWSTSSSLSCLIRPSRISLAIRMGAIPVSFAMSKIVFVSELTEFSLRRRQLMADASLDLNIWRRLRLPYMLFCQMFDDSLCLGIEQNK